jgi:hypothetical protein
MEYITILQFPWTRNRNFGRSTDRNWSKFTKLSLLDTKLEQI